jgi:hypothetical protein
MPADSADLSAPKDPAEYRPRRVMGPGFFAVIAFGVLCVLAGVGVWALAPRFFAHRQAPPIGLDSPAASETAKGAGAAAGTPAEAPPPIVTPAASAASVGQLESRLSALEAGEQRTARAAAAALAASALVDASQTSRPFPEELAALRAAQPGSPEIAALSGLADIGAPSRAALAASFPDYAARAASAARKPGEGANLGDRIVYALSRIVMVRRVAEVTGDSPDALLARAEAHVEDGDLKAAFAALDKLPPAARDAMAPWRARAERRAQIDRSIALLRAHALADLAASARTTP